MTNHYIYNGKDILFDLRYYDRIQVTDDVIIGSRGGDDVEILYRGKDARIIFDNIIPVLAMN